MTMATMLMIMMMTMLMTMLLMMLMHDDDGDVDDDGHRSPPARGARLSTSLRPARKGVPTEGPDPPTRVGRWV